MTRTTALLVLAAILLIVVNLFGEGGTMTRVAKMEKTELQASIDRAAPPPGNAWASSRDAVESEVVQPEIVGGDDDRIDDLADRDEPASVANRSDAHPEDLEDVPFDPRVG